MLDRAFSCKLGLFEVSSHMCLDFKSGPAVSISILNKKNFSFQLFPFFHHRGKLEMNDKGDKWERGDAGKGGKN